MMTLSKRLAFALAAAPLWAGVSACLPAPPEIDGECVVVPRSVLDCRVTGYDDELQSAGLVGYSCSGSERPDYGATMSERVPSGLVCADKGTLDSGDQGYCCTEEVTPCAYDPSAECLDDLSGYQCWGNNRPESLNPAITCGNGYNDDGLVHYCCTGTPEPSKCQQSSAANCSTRLQGYLCRDHGLPQGQDLGSNESRADYFYPTCSTPQQAPNPEYQTFCCFMPAVVPIGGSCINHTEVPGCEPGRFGFACYGPETPEEDYPPMNCPDPGFPGRSAEGYDATLYCCDFE